MSDFILDLDGVVRGIFSGGGSDGRENGVDVQERASGVVGRSEERRVG